MLVLLAIPSWIGFALPFGNGGVQADYPLIVVLLVGVALFAYSAINLLRAIARDADLTEDEKAKYKRLIWLFGPVAAADLLILLRRRRKGDGAS